MSNAVIARMLGDDYQARYFWLAACDLFHADRCVAHVGYELADVKSFDDLVIQYEKPIPGQRGEQIDTDYVQIKFHVDRAGALTFEALMDPAFINAQSESILQKVFHAQRILSARSGGYRLVLVSPWPVHPDDALAELVSMQGGELRLDLLRQGKTAASKMGRVRSAFKQHLGISSDAELEAVLRPLRIRYRPSTLDEVNDSLNTHLRAAGLRPVHKGGLVHPYDDLIRKTHAAGKKIFKRADIEEMCKRDGLWLGSARIDGDPIRLGIRSFSAGATNLELCTDQMLCVAGHFNGRSIHAEAAWNSEVMGKIESFLTANIDQTRPVLLQVEAHASIAFAAGWCCNPKRCGTEVSIIQKSVNGTAFWSASTSQSGSTPAWVINDVKCRGAGNDVALAISATHDVIRDVQHYIEHHAPTVGRIITFTADPAPSTSAVRDGAHAFRLAQEIASKLKTARNEAERTGTLHVFASAPNALLFRLGQHAQGFGPCLLYEYDFDQNRMGAYRRSFALPLRQVPGRAQSKGEPL